MTSEILLGSHLSLSSPDYFLGTAEKAVLFGETCFMFYTGAPQNTKRSPLEGLKIKEGREFLTKHGIKEKNIVVHAPYVINLANTVNPEMREFAERFLSEEMKRTAAFGSSLLVLHPGSDVGLLGEGSLKAVSEALNEVLAHDESGVSICLETMAGKGHEVGRSFEELAVILSDVDKKDRIGFCLDTCHINDEGMDVSDPKTILSEFNRLIGLDRLKVIHLNDSKNARGSHKDRHENIGYGTIGFETLEKWAKEPSLVNVPKILETPMDGDKYPYPKEIEMLRSGVYSPAWREKL